MKHLVVVLIIFISCISCYSAGLAFFEWNDNQALPLSKDVYDVTIDNQLMVVTNNLTFDLTDNPVSHIKFATALPGNIEVTSVRFSFNNIWQDVDLSQIIIESSQGQDYGSFYYLEDYFGHTRLVTELYGTGSADILKVELTYCEILDTAKGEDEIILPALFNSLPFSDSVDFSVNLEVNNSRGLRSFVDNNELLDLSTFSSYHFSAIFSESYNYREVPVEARYLWWNINTAIQGIAGNGFSTLVPEEEEIDNYYNGYFEYLIEPCPDNDIVGRPKAFTLIMDTSGSMAGSKLEQAKASALHIINNLEEDDLFNIVFFNEEGRTFRPTLVHPNQLMLSLARAFIAYTQASGGTNLEAAFDVAFNVYDNTSNLEDYNNFAIVITDGVSYPIEEFLTNLDNQISQLGIDLYMHTISIGEISPLLVSIAQHFHGEHLFVQENSFEDDIIRFWNNLRFPAVSNPTITFNDANNIQEIYPLTQSNIYYGKQTMIAGRYQHPERLEINISGSVYADEVSYTKVLHLNDEVSPSYKFLRKLWAKKKIEHLLALYYQTYPSPYADAYMEEIMEIAVSYNINSPLEEAIDDVPNIDENEDISNGVVSTPITINSNYPNPFNPETEICFTVNANLKKNLIIKVFNIKGQVVKSLGSHVNGPGEYSITWHGDDNNKHRCASGVYFYTIDWGGGFKASKMVLTK